MVFMETLKFSLQIAEALLLPAGAMSEADFSPPQRKCLPQGLVLSMTLDCNLVGNVLGEQAPCPGAGPGPVHLLFIVWEMV